MAWACSCWSCSGGGGGEAREEEADEPGLAAALCPGAVSCMAPSSGTADGLVPCSRGAWGDRWGELESAASNLPGPVRPGANPGEGLAGKPGGAVMGPRSEDRVSRDESGNSELPVLGAAEELAEHPG